MESKQQIIGHMYLYLSSVSASSHETGEKSRRSNFSALVNVRLR